MIPVIGLGNPGEKYKNTRHNVGWLVLDELAGDTVWDLDKYLFSEKKNIKIGEEVAILLKPETFMNESGRVLEGIKRIDPFLVNKIIVVHDEIDLPIGIVKINFDRGDGGHNGIKSINHYFGGKNYVRVRVGISKVGEDGTLHKPNVLGDFDAKDKESLSLAIPKAVEAIKKIILNGKDAAANEINSK